MNRYDIVDNIITMAYEHNLNPFGHRYIGDRRYRVFAIAGAGNGSWDDIYGRVGPYQFELKVDYRNKKVTDCRLLDRDEYFRV